MAFIREENAKQHTYTLGITQFIFLSYEEFSNAVFSTGYRHDSELATSSRGFSKCLASTTTAKSVDWRKKKIFSAIQNQGNCGSCYAISTAELTNALNGLAGTKLNGLSAQQLVDCSQSYGNEGCKGGTTSASMRFIQEIGLVTEQDYPYVGKLQTCKNIANQRYSVSKYDKYSSVSESALQAFVEKSPIVVAIYSTWPPLQVRDEN